MTKWQKVVISSSIIAISSATTIAPFAFKYSLPNAGFKPIVYNYVQYISENAESIINEKFAFRTYNDLPQFKQQLTEGKTIGGVSSDFQIAEFAIQNLIKPIDFNAFFGTTGIIYDENWAKDNYTDFVFQQMSNYDAFLQQKFIEQGKSLEEAKNLGQLWKWTIPYFTQDKVISFNVERLENLSAAEKQDWLKLTPEALNAKFAGMSYVDVFKEFRRLGAQKFAINDIHRQNNAIGSTYNPTNPSGNNPDATGTLNQVNFRTQTDNFVKIVEEGTGFRINDPSRIELNPSDPEILANLINPQRNDAVGVIYNGDAIQTIFTSFVFPEVYDNINRTEKNPVRTIRVANQISLLDGFVVANKISPELEKQFLSTIYRAAFDGTYGLGEFQNGILASDLSVSTHTEIVGSATVVEAINKITAKDLIGENQYKKLANTSGFLNFDFVTYTPATRFQMNIALNHYYSDVVKRLYVEDENGPKNFQEFIGSNSEKQLLIENWAKYIIRINMVPEGSILKPLVVTPASNFVNSISLNYYREKTTS
ncbi:spermidine/putrescine ABC transporter substrate-binding protein [[Mycoplasma] mobile]|uniref:Probable spermidine/putrescine/ABC transporter substrate binding protein n=1 Tax=Mycoplasma mobile (strain ATCC 43663 / 163K / NCTC 11711) TaxID=267748 RepID=Q6KIN9_MYCM1|nr:spermidine/putrescine ABC transporter substrate-binding protein [[Mycoplasma] mobile]AAT27537.1 probable spermidine/putrescine/ABC transporter substrate binding protein [Mycoplasma mobile 163K]